MYSTGVSLKIILGIRLGIFALYSVCVRACNLYCYLISLLVRYLFIPLCVYGPWAFEIYLSIYLSIYLFPKNLHRLL